MFNVQYNIGSVGKNISIGRGTAEGDMGRAEIALARLMAREAGLCLPLPDVTSVQHFL